MNPILYYLYKITEKLFDTLKIETAFKTKCGLKNIHMNKRIKPIEIQAENTVYLKAEDLFLGYDYLKDDFTLLDRPLKESPHYHLMEILYADAGQEAIAQSEYIQRWLSGTLDWRFGFKDPNEYSFFIQRFHQSKENIAHNRIKPVIIYNLAGRYYIYDGKHRAAMCAYNNLQIPCVIVAAETVFTGVWKTLFDKIKKDGDYEKHRRLYQQYELQGVQ